MRSVHVDRFNHDEDADGYDVHVQDERNLIRRGYAACLHAVAQDLSRAPMLPDLPMVDLGVGTGNLAVALPADRPLVLVDISAAMLARAQAKLEGRTVTIVQDDALSWLTDHEGPLGTVGSTFALHHLDPPEKVHLLDALVRRLAPGARVCIGDLGFQDARAQDAFLASEGCPPEVADAIADEFFWDFSLAEKWLVNAGFKVRRRAHGPLIGSLVAMRDED